MFNITNTEINLNMQYLYEIDKHFEKRSSFIVWYLNEMWNSLRSLHCPLPTPAVCVQRERNKYGGSHGTLVIITDYISSYVHVRGVGKPVNIGAE